TGAATRTCGPARAPGWSSRAETSRPARSRAATWDRGPSGCRRRRGRDRPRPAAAPLALRARRSRPGSRWHRSPAPARRGDDRSPPRARAKSPRYAAGCGPSGGRAGPVPCADNAMSRWRQPVTRPPRSRPAGAPAQTGAHGSSRARPDLRRSIAAGDCILLALAMAALVGAILRQLTDVLGDRPLLLAQELPDPAVEARMT